MKKSFFKNNKIWFIKNIPSIMKDSTNNNENEVELFLK